MPSVSGFGSPLVRKWGPALLVFGLVVLAYLPCLRGEFVWDDDAWTVKLSHLLRTWSGLGVIWSKVTALQQYYPLTATSFWLDYQLWGFWSLPYHLENVVLHCLAALLFWRLLVKFDVPGAALAAAIFAVHPVMAESVAWITERKNVLSLVLFLAALWSYGRFARFWAPEPRAEYPGAAPLAANSNTASEGRLPSALTEWRWYGAALLLFIGAYLAKATAFAFPAVLLLIGWWKRGHLHWRADIWPSVPFFLLSIGLGLVTSWLERTHVGARGPDWDLTLPERCVIAGRALWFYVGKLVCPIHLCFIYPRWRIDAASAGQWLWPGMALVVLVALWRARNLLGRGPLAAALFYAGTLLPLLGFINGYFMKYSFVCDHWSYLPSLGLIALAGALLSRAGGVLEEPPLRYALCVLLLVIFGLLTSFQSAMYRDSETLYRVTLARNPAADLAHNNLGLLLCQAGEVEEGIAHLRTAVELRPNSAHAHNNLANALRLVGRASAAAKEYEIALQFEPGNGSTCNNLAMLLATSADASVRNGPRAIELALRANEMSGRTNPFVLGTLAAAYAESGRFEEAIANIRRAIALAQGRAEPRFVEFLRMQLQLYESGSPFHESGPTEISPAEKSPPP